MEAAVRVQDLAGGKVQTAADCREYAVCNILRQTKAADGRYALIDELLVLFVYAGGHIRHDDARTDLEHRDAVLREPVGKQLSRHRDARPGNAVFTAVDRGGVRRHRGDVHNARPVVLEVFLLQLDHPVGRRLTHEERALEVDVHQAVEALLGGFEDAEAHLGRDTGVVHQHIQTAVTLDDGIEQALAVLGSGDVTGDIGAADALGGEPCGDFLVRRGGGREDNEIALLTECLGNAQTDAATRTGD